MDFPLFEVVLKSLAFLIERPLSDFHFQVSMNFNHVIHNHVKSVRTDGAVSTKVGVLLTMSAKDKQIFFLWSEQNYYTGLAFVPPMPLRWWI